MHQHTRKERHQQGAKTGPTATGGPNLNTSLHPASSLKTGTATQPQRASSPASANSLEPPRWHQALGATMIGLVAVGIGYASLSTILKGKIVEGLLFLGPAVAAGILAWNMVKNIRRGL